MHNAAVPLVRKAFEFAITAQWMHHVPNAVDAFLAKSAGSAKKLFEETKTAQIILPDDLITEYEKPAETAPDEVKVLRAFERVCNGFAPGKGNGLYLMYRSLSGICHPSVSAVSRHYELESKADAGVVLTLNGGEEETHILNTLAASLVWAGRAIDQNVKDRPRQAALKQAAREMGVPSILKPVA